MQISSIIDELEDAIASGSPEKRHKALWQVMDLFMDGASRYSDDQIALFDDVILKLAAEIEAKARVKLARRLASVACAPAKVIRSLAFDAMRRSRARCSPPRRGWKTPTSWPPPAARARIIYSRSRNASR